MNEHAFTHRLFPAALGLLGLATTGLAQVPTHTYTGAVGNDRLGAAVAGGRDVTGDGLPDLAIGIPQDLNIFSPGTGAVRIVSGATGLTYTTYQGAAIFEGFGSAIALIGDISSPPDGRADVVIGAPTASVNQSQDGRIEVLSGLDGTVIFSAVGEFGDDRFGSSVAAPGDVDGDGVPDFVVGAPFYSQTVSNGGQVKVFSGATGAVIWTFLGATNNARFGWSVAGGDVNDDGRADIVVGSLFGGVRVYSGATGNQLYALAGGPSDVFGRSVAVVPDLTGDGIADVLVGATQEDIFSPGTGFVRAFSGPTGTPAWTRAGLALGDRFGFSLNGAGAWNADGRTDVVVGAVPQVQNVLGYAQVLSGDGGGVLLNIPAPSANTSFGAAVAGLGDWNGNGKADIAVGIPLDSTNGAGAGKVEVYESPNTGCGVVTAYCAQATLNSTGSQAILSTAGSTSVAAANFVLVCTNLPPNQGGLVFYGANQASVPFQDGFRCVANPIIRLNPPANSGPAGLIVVGVNLNNPAAPITAGSVWNFQMWYRDPAAGNTGSNVSTAVEVNFCP